MKNNKLQNNIRINLYKTGDYLRLTVITRNLFLNVGKSDTGTVLAKIDFIRQSTGGIIAKRVDKDSVYSFPPATYNKLVSIFCNKDVWNLFEGEYWTYVDCSNFMSIKKIIKDNIVYYNIPLELPKFHQWKFYDNDHKIYYLTPVPVLKSVRTISLKQVPNKRLVYASDNGPSMREMTVFAANMYEMWKRVKTEKDLFLDMGDCGRSRISHIGSSCRYGEDNDTFIFNDFHYVRIECGETIVITLPVRQTGDWICEYITKNVKVLTNNDEVPYTMIHKND